MTCFLCEGRKILGFSVWIDINLVFVRRHHNFSGDIEINLIFVWGIEFDLDLMLGSKVTCLLCGGGKLTVCGPKLTCFDGDDRLTRLLRGWWSKLTRFLDAGRQSPGFSVSIEIGLVLVWMVNIDLISVWRVKLDIISVWGSQLIYFVSACRKWLAFRICIETDLDFVWCSTANRYGALRDECYVLEDGSVTVSWVPQWFILHKRAKDVRAWNFRQDWLSSSVSHPI